MDILLKKVKSGREEAKRKKDGVLLDRPKRMGNRVKEVPRT
jgi:hypothetical protein